VGNEGLTVLQASALYSVPRKTLDDRVKKWVVHGTKTGRGTVLSTEEEKGLCNYFVYMAQREFPLMHRMVMVIVWAISLRSGRGSRFNPELGPSDRWWSNFR
jgi:hypothetical protein